MGILYESSDKDHREKRGEATPWSIDGSEGRLATERPQVNVASCVTDSDLVFQA